MTNAMTVFAACLICAGIFFLFMGAVGLIRFPDFYTRMHAAGKCDTLGSLLLLVGLAIYQGFDFSSVKLLAIAIFIFFTSPTAAHAITRAAYINRLPLWTRGERE